MLVSPSASLEVCSPTHVSSPTQKNVLIVDAAMGDISASGYSPNCISLQK